jgi:ribosome-associated protein
MDIRKLQRAIVDGLEDVKAQHIAVFNTEHLSALFERVIIASGASNRQTRSLAASVRDSVKSRGLAVMLTEGEENGEWIIVDCGAAVVHIMQPAIRDYYHLEEIWGGKAVRMKLGADGATGLAKASEEPPRTGTSRVSARYMQPDRAAANEPSAKAAPRRAPRSPARPPSARKPVSRKPAAAKKAAPRSPVRKTRA